jgi:PAS fold
MRITASYSRDNTDTPAALPRPRQPERRLSGGTRQQQDPLITAQSGDRRETSPEQWLAFVAVGMISLMLIALIWTLTARAIGEEATELRARTDQQLSALTFVLARDVQDELQLVDQSLAIIQNAWNKDAGTVDLGAWRRQLLALTEVANDIFIANDHGIIVQGTLPQSIGQGFGSAYVTYPNGSLQTFGPTDTTSPNDTTNPNGKPPSTDGVQARQFLTYILRPLAQPPGWMIGASFRSTAITELFSGARLGQSGIIGLVALKRGGLQAIAGPSAQFAKMDIATSELIEQMRKRDAGVWAGVSPIDHVSRIFAYQRIPNRDLGVLVGVSMDAANEPLASLAATAHGLAAVGSLVVLTIAGMVMWTSATVRATQQRRRIHEHIEIDLTNTRQELMVARTRALLSESEAGALIGSATDGVARLDADQKLWIWNECFAERAGVALDGAAPGMPVEELFRYQAASGLFGDATDARPAIAARLALLHTAAGSAEAPIQRGPNDELLMMFVRGVSDGGHLLLLTRADNARLAVLPEAGSAMEAA